ncbi:MAG TPA: STAS domain-containing protein [Pseudonocardiaceae bacterium]|nr:STAS domain-containing protein [Pseudonocardiaceae bacterium]
MPPRPLFLDVDRRNDGVPCLVVAGEIDLATAGVFETAAAALLDERPRALVLDFSGVPFCDSSGIGVLVRLYNRATVIGCRLSLRHPTPNVRGVLDMTSLTRILRVEDDEPDPSAAPRADA